MKKLLGIILIGVLALFGLTSCGEIKSQKDLNDDLIKVIEEIDLDKGKVVFEVNEENKKTVYITKVGATSNDYNWYYVTKLTQYNNYFVLEVCGDYSGPKHLTRTYSNNYYWEFTN